MFNLFTVLSLGPMQSAQGLLTRMIYDVDNSDFLGQICRASIFLQNAFLFFYKKYFGSLFS